MKQARNYIATVLPSLGVVDGFGGVSCMLRGDGRGGVSIRQRMADGRCSETRVALDLGLGTPCAGVWGEFGVGGGARPAVGAWFGVEGVLLKTLGFFVVP